MIANIDLYGEAVTVEFDYTPAEPAILHGDNAYPGWPEEIEPIALTKNGEDVSFVLANEDVCNDIIDAIKEQGGEQ